MTKRSIVTPLLMNRRELLKASGFAAAGLLLPSWLTGCGSDSEPTSSPQPVAQLTVDPSKPWWLQNGFEPVPDEIDAVNLRVRGAIPPELNGLYVRNGSNPQKADSPHWFFGDGMVHGVRLENGQALSYSNRYVRTPLYEHGFSFGQGGPPNAGNNQSNVSCVYHAGKLLTSGEVGFPYEINPADLSTVGVYSFADKLVTSFTAHPKIDPATGYLHFFGYWYLPPYLTYHVADTQGRIILTQQISVRKPTMIHSFAITESDAIFWELPVVFDLQAALNGDLNPFKWTPSYGARLGIMPLMGTGRDIRWVDIEPCYVFHEVNAYRQGDEVVIDVCRLNSVFDGEDLNSAISTHHRWRVNTSGTQLAFRDETITDQPIDLPAHDRRFTGRPHRYGWFVHSRPNPDTPDLGGTARVDYQTGRLSLWDPGAGRHSNEPFFVPGGAGEGEGWLLTFVFNRSRNVSDLVILDATNVAAGPVAEIEMPRRVPHGFHGVWIPA